MVYKILLITSVLLTNIFAANNLKLSEDFQAQFIQIVKNETGKTIEYKGEIAVKKSGKVLWKYKEPIIKNVYVVDNFAIVDEPELEQAIYTSLDKGINIKKLLEDAVKLSEEKFKSRIYERDYFIGVKGDKIDSITYKDELANEVFISFFNIETIELSDEIFKFLAPEHYDIIKK